MFEDSLFASQNRVTSPNARWSTAFSIVVQALLAAAVIVFPLLHPVSLPHRNGAIQLALPLPKQPPPPTVVQRAASAAASLVPAIGHLLQAPRIAPTRIDATPDPAPSTAFGLPLGASVLPGALFSGDTGPAARVSARVSVTPTPEKKSGPVRVSAGVSTGLLLTPIRPIYPQIARAAHVEGSVIVAAVISKTGTIESLHVLSGPAMLQSSALDAIRAARYQPFQLNGEPTEVQTTITVNFKLSS